MTTTRTIIMTSTIVLFVFQADDLYTKFGTAAVQNIKKDYGKNPDTTGLWDTTMTTVCVCVCVCDTAWSFFSFSRRQFSRPAPRVTRSLLPPHQLQCCGFYNSSDFVGSPYYVDQKQKYPPQCCPGKEIPCNQAVADSDTVWNNNNNNNNNKIIHVHDFF